MQKVDYDTRLHAVYAARAADVAGGAAHLDGGAGSAPARVTTAGVARSGLGYRPDDPRARDRLRRPGVRRRAVGQDACTGDRPRRPSERHVCSRVRREHPVAGRLVRRRVAVLRMAPRGRSRSRRSGGAPGRQTGGRVFVQANFSDRMPDVWWFRVVPEWKRIDAAQFRTEEEVTRDFVGAGWTLVSRDEVTWPRSASLAEDYERLEP